MGTGLDKIIIERTAATGLLVTEVFTKESKDQAISLVIMDLDENQLAHTVHSHGWGNVYTRMFAVLSELEEIQAGYPELDDEELRNILTKWMDGKLL